MRRLLSPSRHSSDGTASTYVESLESRLEKSEALNRQLRAELANAYFITSEKAAGGSSSDTDSRNNGENSRLTDRHTATLQSLRTALGTLSAPPLPPHDDDLVHLDIQRQVCADVQPPVRASEANFASSRNSPSATLSIATSLGEAAPQH